MAEDTLLVKAKFHYVILVVDRSEAGRKPAASWNLAYQLASSELARVSRSVTSCGPVCDHESVMEFELDQLRTVCDQL